MPFKEMPFSKIVVSLENAKKLRDLGMHQRTILCWCKDPMPYGDYRVILSFLATFADPVYPAFTAQELLDRIPEDCDFSIGKNKTGIFVSYGSNVFTGDNLADLLVEMLTPR